MMRAAGGTIVLLMMLAPAMALGEGQHMASAQPTAAVHASDPPRLFPGNPLVPSRLLQRPDEVKRLPPVRTSGWEAELAAGVRLVGHEESCGVAAPAPSAANVGKTAAYDAYYDDSASEPWFPAEYLEDDAQEHTRADYESADEAESQRSKSAVDNGLTPGFDEYGTPIPVREIRREKPRRPAARPQRQASTRRERPAPVATPAADKGACDSGNCDVEDEAAATAETATADTLCDESLEFDAAGELEASYEEPCDGACDGACDGVCDGDECLTCEEEAELQGIYFRASALILKRDLGVGDQVLAGSGLARTPVMGTQDVDFEFEVGPRALAGFNLTEKVAIEFEYFGGQHWHTSRQVTGPGNLSIPGDLALASLDYRDADRIRFDYSSELHNGEFHLVRRLGRIDVFSGFRFLSLDEKANLASFDTTTGESDYNVRVSNDLYGGQVGASLVVEREFWGFDAFVKGGAYMNDVQQRQTVGDFDNQIRLRDARSDDTDNSFIGEVGAHLSYYFNDRISLRGGYNALWIDGVALAPNQFDFTDTAQSGQAIDLGATVFLHGANVGLEVIW